MTPRRRQDDPDAADGWTGAPGPTTAQRDALAPADATVHPWTWEPVTYADPAALHRYPWNPRHRMKPHRFARLVRGIERFGLAGPFTVRDEDGGLIGGHQRLDAVLVLLAKHGGNPAKLRQMNLPGGLVPVQAVRGMPEPDARALNVLLNNRGAQADDDFVRLQDVLSELDATGYDATVTGWDGDALASVLTWTPDPAVTMFDPLADAGPLPEREPEPFTAAQEEAFAVSRRLQEARAARKRAAAAPPEPVAPVAIVGRVALDMATVVDLALGIAGDALGRAVGGYAVVLPLPDAPAADRQTAARAVAVLAAGAGYDARFVGDAHDPAAVVLVHSGPA